MQYDCTTVQVIDRGPGHGNSRFETVICGTDPTGEVEVTLVVRSPYEGDSVGDRLTLRTEVVQIMNQLAAGSPRAC